MLKDEDRYLKVMKAFLAKVEDIEAGRAENKPADDFSGGLKAYLND